MAQIYMTLCAKCGHKLGYPHHPFGQCAIDLTNEQAQIWADFRRWQMQPTPSDVNDQATLLWCCFRAGATSQRLLNSADRQDAEPSRARR